MLNLIRFIQFWNEFLCRAVLLCSDYKSIIQKVFASNFPFSNYDDNSYGILAFLEKQVFDMWNVFYVKNLGYTIGTFFNST